MAREGARVVVTDLNHIAAEKTKQDLEAIGNFSFLIKKHLDSLDDYLNQF